MKNTLLTGTAIVALGIYTVNTIYIGLVLFGPLPYPSPEHWGVVCLIHTSSFIVGLFAACSIKPTSIDNR